MHRQHVARKLHRWGKNPFLWAILFLFVLTGTATAQDAAPLGTPYSWSQNSSPTSNANRSSAPWLNEIGNTADINLDSTGGVTPNTYDAGGVIWTSARRITSVAFVNGSWDPTRGDGSFCANLSMQTTIDGSTWTDSGWSVSPSYSYDSSGAGLQTYTFSGTSIITVLGVRVSGEVHCSDTDSWYANMREIIADAPVSQTIWSPSTVPSIVDVGDYSVGSNGGGLNLGVRFQSSVDGTISGIRFYKAGANAGTHVGTLYNDTGTVLAQATFTHETGSGWQEVDFAPVSIVAGTIYVAAYYLTNGDYSVDGGYFNSAHTNGQQLTAPASGSEGNGVFLYNESIAFPNQTYNSNNYWVDVVFNYLGGVPPLSATSLPGTALSSERVKLTWTASPGDVTGLAYDVYRNGDLAGTTNSTSYIDIGLSPSTTYCYYIVAHNGYGTAVRSATVDVTTTANYMPANLQNFFPVGPDGQPSSSLSHWASPRGANTLIRTPVGLAGTDFTTWNSTADSLPIQYIRQADPTNPAYDIGKSNLLAWHQEDEPEYRRDANGNPAPIPASTIVAQYNTWKQIDPNRAVSLNFSGAVLIGQEAGWCDAACYAAYLPGGDWLMSDVYPVSGWGRPDKLSWVGQSVDTLYGMAPNKPIMQFIESAYANVTGCWGNCPAPTPEQFRGEFWDAIVHGARGVFIFPERNNPFGFDNTTPDMDAEITTQWNTVKPLASVLQGVINPIGMSATVSSPLEVTWRNYNGHQYIFVLNFSYNAKTARTITLTGIGSATQAVVYGESRNVPISNTGVITDDFGPHAIHIYQVN